MQGRRSAGLYFLSWVADTVQCFIELRAHYCGMWPWFRWMSTSNLHSSNQQSLTETHARSLLHWLSMLQAVLILQFRWASGDKLQRQRYPQTQGSGAPTPGCSSQTSSQRLTDPGSSCTALSEVWKWQAPRHLTWGPPGPCALTVQTRCWVFQQDTSKRQVGASNRKGEVYRQGEKWQVKKTEKKIKCLKFLISFTIVHTKVSN